MKEDVYKRQIMDNDPEKLRIFGGLSRHIVKKEGSSLEVELTDNIASAATGADYVVTTLRVGQDAQRCVDERIALDRGLIGQETTGAGGFSYAIRTIPVSYTHLDVYKRQPLYGLQIERSARKGFPWLQICLQVGRIYAVRQPSVVEDAAAPFFYFVDEKDIPFILRRFAVDGEIDKAGADGFPRF